MAVARANAAEFWTRNSGHPTHSLRIRRFQTLADSILRESDAAPILSCLPASTGQFQDFCCSHCYSVARHKQLSTGLDSPALHLIGIAPPGADASSCEALARALPDQGIVVAARGACVRESPYLHNGSADGRRLALSLARVWRAVKG